MSSKSDREKQMTPPQNLIKRKTLVAEATYNYHSAAAGGSPRVSPLLSTSSIVIILVDESPRQ